MGLSDIWGSKARQVPSGIGIVHVCGHVFAIRPGSAASADIRGSKVDETASHICSHHILLFLALVLGLGWARTVAQGWFLLLALVAQASPGDEMVHRERRKRGRWRMDVWVREGGAWGRERALWKVERDIKRVDKAQMNHKMGWAAKAREDA